MLHRNIVSICIAVVFVSLSITGIWLFFFTKASTVIFLHVFFEALFLACALLHFSKNWFLLKGYLFSKVGKRVLIVLISIVMLTITNPYPFSRLSEVYASFKASQPMINSEEVLYTYQLDSQPNLSLEIKADKHFWFPQIVVWAEDMQGNFLKTLFVTHSTAKGDFNGGRTKENFKVFDNSQNFSNYEKRRVDALPYWSHARGIEAADGLYAPTDEQPIPDGISGATPEGSFRIETKYPTLNKFKILLETNVAFDDNKFYSNYDYPDDSLYHSGTGLLGQPSVVYEALINIESDKIYYILDYAGHTYPSGISGELFRDSQGLTTAKNIIDLVLLKVENKTLELASLDDG